MNQIPGKFIDVINTCHEYGVESALIVEIMLSLAVGLAINTGMYRADVIELFQKIIEEKIKKQAVTS